MPESALFASQMFKQAINELFVRTYQLYGLKVMASGSVIVDGYETLLVRVQANLIIRGTLRKATAECLMKDAMPASLGAEESDWLPENILLTIDDSTSRWRYAKRVPPPDELVEQEPKISRFSIHRDYGNNEGPQPAIAQ